jgi:V/A-type H+-transporting ATPase subunit E
MVAPKPDSTPFVELIRQQADQESAEIVCEARERAARIAAAAEAEAASILQAARASGEERGSRRAAKLLAAAETTNQRELLRAREAILNEALERVRLRLADFVNLPDAPAVLCRLILSALPVLPEGPVRLRVPPTYAALLDATTLAELGGRRWTLELVQDPKVAAGVILESADGRRRVDQSFEARMTRERDHLRRMLAEVLLGD